MRSAPTDAVSYYSNTAEIFHKSYRSDPNRLERRRVWKDFFDRYTRGVRFAYDIGCGSGILACELARRGIETIGIDGAPSMLAIARDEARREGLGNLNFQQHRLPISNLDGFRPADLVISSSAIEYLESIHDALTCLRDLLRPNGVVIFSVSNRQSWSRAAVRLVHRVTGYPAYLGLLKHFMTVEEIRAQLADAGLIYLEHSYFARADRINRLLRLVLPPRLSSNMIIVAARRPADIPRLGQNPKILGRDDAEVIRYLITIGVPFSGHLLAQKGQYCSFEIAECLMTSIVGDVPVHEAP